MHIPDKSLFTAGTLRSFKLDFDEINFENKYMFDAFNESVMITLDRDNVEKIKATSYKFFKGILENKIDEYKMEEQKDLEFKKEVETYW